MEPVVMTPEELKEFINNMPDDMILRIVMEESHEPEDDRKV